MSHAAGQGQLMPGVDPAAALALLYGPLNARLLFGDTIPSEAEIVAYLDIACRGIFVGG